MNNKEFIAALSERTGYGLGDTQRLVSRLVDAVGDTFVAGNAVQVQGFGLFETRKKMERTIVNPSTGRRMLVPPKLVLTFKPTTAWKDKVRNISE